MQLHFKSKYKSIKTLQAEEMNNFSILVGLNGSGKTQLLDGIKRGNILVDSISRDKISYFNFQTFLINNQREANLRNIDDEKLLAWTHLQKSIHHLKGFDKIIKSIVGEDKEFPYECEVEDSQKAAYEEGKSNLLRIAKSCPTDKKNFKKLILSAISQSGKFASELSQQDFMLFADYDIAEYELLQNLSEIFINYQKQIITAKIEKGSKGETFNEKQLQSLNENSPWEFINKMFHEFGLPHKITAPTFTWRDLIYSQSLSFQVKLNVNGDEIDFEEISSGEKILCALAITVYQDKKSSFPELLLLDEIDASLHPSIINNLLDVINNVFLKHGSKVILATHSPTTVALGNYDSLYEIKENAGEKVIKKIGQSQAINILSGGYMTFSEGLKITRSIDKSKKVQILSEGYNIKHIKKAIEILDPHLLTQIHFITGAEDKTGKQQLKNAYEIMQGSIDNIFLFVWDCDARSIIDPLSENEYIKKFYFLENPENTKCMQKDRHSGIEDLYTDDLFTDDIYDIIQEIVEYGGNVAKKLFNKNKFFDKVNRLNDAKVFKNFQTLLDKIRSIII